MQAVYAEYGVAFTYRFVIPKAGSTDFAVSSDWTPVAADTQVSKDGGTPANTTNLPAVIAGGTVIWTLTLTPTEMQAASVFVRIVDAPTKAVVDQAFRILTFGNAAAHIKSNFNDTVRLGLTALPNFAAGADGGLPTVDANNAVKLQSGTGANQIRLTSGDVRLDATALADVNAQVDTALDTPIPGSPAGDSINERLAALDDLLQATGAGDAAAIKTATDQIGTIENLGTGASVAKNLRDIAGVGFDNATDSNQEIRDNLAGGAGDWTAGEKNQIRYRLQIDGDQSGPPMVDAPLQLPVDIQAVSGDTAADDRLLELIQSSQVHDVATGGGPTSVVLDPATAPPINSGVLVDSMVHIVSGTGAGQTRHITAYTVSGAPAVHTVTIDRPWVSGLEPVAGDSRVAILADCSKRLANIGSHGGTAAVIDSDIQGNVTGTVGTALALGTGGGEAVEQVRVQMDAELEERNVTAANMDLIGDINTGVADTVKTGDLPANFSDLAISNIEGKVVLQTVEHGLIATATRNELSTVDESLPAQGAPPATLPAIPMITWLYKFLRNKSDQSATLLQIYNDDGVTVDHKAPVSSTLGVTEREKIISGP